MTSDVSLWRRVARIVGGLLLAYLIFDLISRLVYIVVWRSRWKPAIDALRRFNKKVSNPRALKAAGKRDQTLSALHHTGRRSGREYVVPVWAQRVGQSFYVPLPYGADVDWCRNVLASGGCAIEHDGVRYDTVARAIVPAGDVAPKLAGQRRRMFGLMGVESFLRLDVSPVSSG